jgi:hydrogenase-4 component B
MSILFSAALLSPLLLAVLAPLCVPARLLRALLPVVALPGCVFALTMTPDFTLSAPWLLLGADWGVRGVRSVFLLMTAALWALGGLYAAGYVQRRLRSFCVGWGLSLAGNLQLVLATDIVGFYTGFAVMLMAFYILVVHQRDRPAHRAGAV